MPFPCFAAPALGVFDRVLVDAPCSGSGRVCLAQEQSAPGSLAALREALQAISPRALAAQAARQRALLLRGVQLLRPGGLLIYSTCSLEPEENEDVVQW